MKIEPFFEDKTVRWGIIGCGDVTEVKSGPAYKITKGFELSAVMRRDVDKARDYAQRHKVPKYYGSAEELINDADIDAVYIATPPDSHKLYGLKVAEAGKPCCIEKPLAPNYADSLAIYNAFETKGIPLFVAYYRRSLPRFDQVGKWIKSGAIGEIRHVSWNLSKPPNEIDLRGEYNWRTDVKVAPAGYFDDLASHGLDLFVHLFGNVADAKGIAVNQQQLYSAKDAITACWQHENGITGEGSWNFGGYEMVDEVQIYGSSGKITFSVFDEAPLVLRNDKEVLQLDIAHPKHIQEYHVDNIRRHLYGEQPHPSPGAAGVHTSWVMDKILGVL